ncbi:MAG: prephenate dehydratase [Alphaproteobacteria bacterium]|nr:prephenate dehydratase [Alphaproteobacteria bacterium]
MSLRVAYQGNPGSYSDLAVRHAFPDAERIPTPNFDALIGALQNGDVDHGLLPCENSLYGRVGGIHQLLPDSGLHIIGEHFQRVEHCLMAPRGATLADLRFAHSQDVALGQVRRVIAELKLQEVAESDTALSAKHVAEMNDKAHAAIASELAADIYGLSVLRRNVEDEAHNTTRFYVAAREPAWPAPDAPDIMTSFLFRVKNKPAALFSAMVGLATNGINMTKLESYMLGGQFVATQFLCEVEGHPAQPALARALDDMKHHADHVRVLGVYPVSPYRRTV